MMKKEHNLHSKNSVESSKPKKKLQDYVYLNFRKGFTAWKQGSHIIRNISDLLHLEPGAFADGR